MYFYNLHGSVNQPGRDVLLSVSFVPLKIYVFMPDINGESINELKIPLTPFVTYGFRQSSTGVPFKRLLRLSAARFCSSREALSEYHA